MKKKQIDFTKPQFVVSLVMTKDDTEPRYLSGSHKEMCTTRDIRDARLVSFNRAMKLGKEFGNVARASAFEIYLFKSYIFGLLTRRVLIARFNKEPKPRKFL